MMYGKVHLLQPNVKETHFNVVVNGFLPAGKSRAFYNMHERVKCRCIKHSDQAFKVFSIVFNVLFPAPRSVLGSYFKLTV